MRITLNKALLAGVALAGLSTASCIAAPPAGQPASVAPASMPRVGAIDARFQSYNIEMVEVTGGRFWKPYASKAAAAPGAPAAANQPVGMDPGLYEYRSPIDLGNPRLRKLAAALGPAYLRVSGTWANTTFFYDSDDPAPATPPKGFSGILTRKQWKGVVDFSRATNAAIVTSVAISPGTRDAAGVWTPDQARLVFAYTKSLGGSIAAAEYMNEPNIAAMGGAPSGYNPAAYARDAAIFRAFAKQAAPSMIFLGLGSAGEGSIMPAGPAATSMRMLSSADLFTATGPVFDAVSYHSYGAVSSRCSMFGAGATTTADAALSDDWLARAGKIEDFYGSLRDRFEPGKPLWNTETAQAACGGDKWASTFLDSIRYINQLGILARRGVQVHMHNTLAASDYGLLDEKTYEPRPNYWAALVWHKLMGTTVLDPGPAPAHNLYLYAQCLPNHPGGVTLVVLNASKTAAQSLQVPTASERYSLTAQDLLSRHVQLNQTDLELGDDDALPSISGVPTRAGQVIFEPASITFLAMPKAHNASCRQ